ncbi:MAG: FtsX-like permease family protein, partial [bacterium]|nr:FtsX-like permease family protein [bacterium]
MFKSYLKTALRNIVRHKGYSFINIFGLAVGMAVCILILLWVRQELGFDRFHHNADDIYRVNKIWRKGETAHQAITPAPLAPALKENFPGIIETARFSGTGIWLLRNGDRAFYEQGGVFTDPTVFNMFTFPLVKGNPETALANPFSMVLTETMAAKYFGGQNPVGKTVRVDNLYDFSVTGVMKDIPRDSHLQFDFLVPFAHVGRPGLQARFSQPTLADWHNNAFYSYVLLKKGVSYKEVNKKIDRYLKKPIPGSTSTLYLQKLRDIHLRSTHLTGVLPGAGDITYIYLFAAMALIVLLIACINFMNLTTARSGKRAREIGLRKVVGARRSAIIKQFFGESLVMALIALTFALLLVELLLPAFNEISGKQLTLDFTGSPVILLGLAAITLFTGLAAGSYPALFLSSFQPAEVLKGAVRSGTRGGRTRKALVIFQFSLTVIFLVGAVVIHNQLDYLQGKKLGFDKEHLVYLEIPEALRSRYLSIKNEFRQNSSVSGVTASVSLPSFGRDI